VRTYRPRRLEQNVPGRAAGRCTDPTQPVNAKLARLGIIFGVESFSTYHCDQSADRILSRLRDVVLLDHPGSSCLLHLGQTLETYVFRNESASSPCAP
jgi:hypothetical protein